jgi:3-hydroxyisobutyrate dehydrogenase
MAETIAFIGLGNMGGPMAANLVEAGLRVQGFDLVSASREAAARNGVLVSATTAEAIAEADVVITMLPAGKHVTSVWKELAGAIEPGTPMIDCSTIDVESAHKSHALAAGKGCLSLDAPVSAGTFDLHGRRGEGGVRQSRADSR